MGPFIDIGTAMTTHKTEIIDFKTKKALCRKHFGKQGKRWVASKDPRTGVGSIVFLDKDAAMFFKLKYL